MTGETSSHGGQAEAFRLLRLFRISSSRQHGVARTRLIDQKGYGDLALHMEKLRSVLRTKDEHLVAMLDGSLSILESTGNPLRFAFCALGLRELLREFFSVTAPDAEIRTCKWWKSPDERVTRRDRITYFVYRYVDPSLFAKNYAAQIDAAAGELIGHIDKLSACLHVTREQLIKDEAAQKKLMDETLAQFARVAELAEEHRAELEDQLASILDEALTLKFCTGSAFDELDILSTHTRPTGACDIAVKITGMTRDQISFTGSGTVECDLQFGSDGDVRRGDGVEWGDSFPFTFAGTAPTDDPRDVEVPRESIDIDTSEYFGDPEE